MIEKLDYKGNKIEVHLVETSKKNYVYDIIVNEGYWGTCFSQGQMEEHLTNLKKLIDDGKPLWEA